MKHDTITFKADSALSEALRGMPNRSDFLRSAVLAALHNTCPLCKGTGILSLRQMEHWEAFAKKHHFEKCEGCDEYRLVCEDSAAPARCHTHKRKSRSKS